MIPLVRHLLATLRYRTRRALDGAPEGFGDFRAGEGVRSPAEIVRHMTSLLAFTRSVLLGEERRRVEPLDDLGSEVARFETALEELDRQFVGGDGAEPNTLMRLAQGPLSDAATHVGQLAMLRRLAGSPVPAENFFRADIMSFRDVTSDS